MSLAWNVRTVSGAEEPPVNWTVRRIRDLVTLVNGYPFPSESFGPTGDIPLVRIRDLTAETFETYVSGHVPETVLLRDGDVVIGMDGEFNLTVWNRGPAALNQRLCLLRPRADVDMRFIAYTLPPSLKIINDLTFATTVKHLSSNDVLSERVMLPPSAEQRRIADFLDAVTARIDQGIQTAVRGRALLDERRWAMVHALSTGVEEPEPRRPVELGWVGEIPTSWPVVPLKFVASLGTGHTPSRSKPEYWEDCTIPWISLFDVGRMRDVRQKELSTTQQQISPLGMANSSACLHPAGTVVLSRTASVGFSTIMGVNMAVSQHFVTWTCGSNLLPSYLLMLLRSMRQYFESVQVGTTNVTVFMPDLYSIKVPLPPVDVQRRIVKRIDQAACRIDALAERFDRQVALLRERRQALITAAVTGQFDVSTASGRNVTEGVTV
jgi:type I restriction enzyme S subunit